MSNHGTDTGLVSHLGRVSRFTALAMAVRTTILLTWLGIAVFNWRKTFDKKVVLKSENVILEQSMRHNEKMRGAEATVSPIAGNPVTRCRVVTFE